ncbi:MAG TPA: ABC transporter permease [Actinomycetaceae bacterium]|nr:ABC transporter permease [Actinomycetaceae bacterium]
MGIAWKDLRRNPGRYAIATFTLTLIAMLLMFLGALLAGLLGSITGSYLAQPDGLLVYSSDANSTLGSSVITAETRDEIEQALPAGAEMGSIGSLVLGARIDGGDERDLTGVDLFGTELDPAGVTLGQLGPGEVWADPDLGFAEGEKLLLGPTRFPVTVVGVVEESSSPSEGALWTTADMWREVLAAARPGATLPDGASQGLVIALPEGDVDVPAVADAVDRATGTTESLTIAEAAAAIPGVSAQSTVFAQIQAVTLAIGLLVVGLFFALLTVERTALFGVLKAMGSRTNRIFAGVVLQALVVTGVASAIGAVLVIAADAFIPPGTVPFALSAPQIGLAVGALALAAIIGSAFSLRRVLRIDPAAAIGGDA